MKRNPQELPSKPTRKRSPEQPEAFTFQRFTVPQKMMPPRTDRVLVEARADPPETTPVFLEGPTRAEKDALFRRAKLNERVLEKVVSSHLHKSFKPPQILCDHRNSTQEEAKDLTIIYFAARKGRSATMTENARGAFVGEIVFNIASVSPQTDLSDAISDGNLPAYVKL